MLSLSNSPSPLSYSFPSVDGIGWGYKCQATKVNHLWRVPSHHAVGASGELLTSRLAPPPQACFDYLSLGGIYSSGPISLLSGLNPRPSVLVAHFFMVAIYGVGRLLFPRPTFHGIYMSFALLLTACGIIFPIILAEGPAAVFLPLIAGDAKLKRTDSYLKIDRTASFDRALAQAAAGKTGKADAEKTH